MFSVCCPTLRLKDWSKFKLLFKREGKYSLGTSFCLFPQNTGIHPPTKGMKAKSVKKINMNKMSVISV